jgi:hypothetical protein
VDVLRRAANVHHGADFTTAYNACVQRANHGDASAAGKLAEYEAATTALDGARAAVDTD